MRVRPVAWLACVAALLMLASARSTSAQSSLILPETHIVQFGPVALYPTFALRDAGLDSNVYNDTSSPKSDFTYRAVPKFYAVLPVGHNRLVGTALGNFVYYKTYKDQQSIGGLFEGRYEVLSPGFRPFAAVGLVDHREQRGFEVDQRVRQRQTTLTLGADMDLSSRTALTAWVGRLQTAWDRDAQYRGVSLSEQLDYRTDTVAGGVQFRATPLTTVGVIAELQRDRFDRSPVRDADKLFVGPSVDIDPGAAVVGHARVGYQRFDPVDPIVAGYRGAAALAELRYTFRDLTEVKFDARRDVDYSYDPIQPYYMESGAVLAVSQRVFGPLHAIAIGERHALRHQRLGGSSFDGRQDTTRTAGGGVAVQVQKQIRFELIYQRTARSSTDPSWLAYERRRLFASIFYGL